MLKRVDGYDYRYPNKYETMNMTNDKMGLTDKTMDTDSDLEIV